MHGGNRRVSAVTLGFGRESEHQHTRYESAQAHDQRDRPWPRELPGYQAISLADRQRGPVAAHRFEQQLRRALQSEDERDRPETGNDADENTEYQPLPQVGPVLNASYDFDHVRPASFHPNGSTNGISPAASAKALSPRRA